MSIEITITGPIKSGKTTAAIQLSQFFKDKGAKVKIYNKNINSVGLMMKHEQIKDVSFEGREVKIIDNN